MPGRNGYRANLAYVAEQVALALRQPGNHSLWCGSPIRAQGHETAAGPSVLADFVASLALSPQFTKCKKLAGPDGKFHLPRGCGAPGGGPSSRPLKKRTGSELNSKNPADNNGREASLLCFDRRLAAIFPQLRPPAEQVVIVLGETVGLVPHILQ